MIKRFGSAFLVDGDCSILVIIGSRLYESIDSRGDFPHFFMFLRCSQGFHERLIHSYFTA